MLFNSFEFIIFLGIIFLIYWRVRNEYKIPLLLISSNVFYGFWDAWFLILLNVTILIDFFCGLKISSAVTNSSRKKWLYISLISCLSMLFFFKYSTFFIEIINSISINHQINIHYNIVLPIGISFYTFHGISYIVDVYNYKVKVEKNFSNYALFVSFFPLLVAGPIERANNLLNQISNRVIRFNYTMAVSGLRLILVGFFKKTVLADNLATIVDDVYKYHSLYSGSTLLFATIIFGFQIYYDFSGYTNIAGGVSKLFGYELIINFNYPYFAKNPKDFWSRWHISLSSFFRDYVYIPLGGNRQNKFVVFRNILIVFILSGLWHGANFTFLIWGFYHAILIVLFSTFDKYKFIPLAKVIQALATFFLINIGWVFFRSPDVNTCVEVLNKIFSYKILAFPYIENGSVFFKILLITIVFILIEFFAYKLKLRDVDCFFEIIKPKIFRYLIYYIIMFLVLALSFYAEKKFIYFQF